MANLFELYLAGRAATDSVAVHSEPKPAENASINASGYLTSPLKDAISGTNSNYSAWRGGALYDVFDPALNTEWQSELGNTGKLAMQQIRSNNPYLLGVLTDDGDYFWGAGTGPDFVTGHTNANIAWVTLITSPVQTYIQSTPFGKKTLLYTTTQNYSKTLAMNPKTACSISSPCSLRDYLWQKYNGTISALNTAWGSNYTTFDSAGTQVSGETVGTGDGTTIVFTHTLAHASGLHSASSSPSKARPRWGIVRGFTAAVAPQRRRRGP